MDAKNTSLRESAYYELKNRIINCTLAPGSIVNEEMLRSELAMSRTPIREALTRLERDGFVQIMPKKGILITNVTSEDIQGIYEVRMLIEPYLIRTHGDRLDRDMLADFLRRHEEILQQVDHGRNNEPLQHSINSLDNEFHRWIAASTGAPYFDSMQKILLDQNQRIRILSGLHAVDRFEKTLTEHIHILTALLDRDLPTAEAWMMVHLSMARSAALRLQE